MVYKIIGIFIGVFLSSFLGTFCAIDFISWVRRERRNRSAEKEHDLRMAAIEEGKLRIFRS